VEIEEAEITRDEGLYIRAKARKKVWKLTSWWWIWGDVKKISRRTETRGEEI